MGTAGGESPVSPPDLRPQHILPEPPFPEWASLPQTKLPLPSTLLSPSPPSPLFSSDRDRGSAALTVGRGPFVEWPSGYLGRRPLRGPV